MFRQGSLDKSLKMGPGRMREMLITNHPDRFDIPSEAELHQQISKFIAREKKGQPLVPEEGTGGRGRKSPFSSNTLHYMLTLFNENPEVKPAVFAITLKQRLADAGIEWDLDTKKVKSKCSTLKSKYNKDKVPFDVPPLT